MSTMLQYTLCVSRFAHYIKAIARDKMGSFATPEECEDFLHRWLQKYVTPDSEASAAVKARLPLREARVEVSEQPGKPGSYRCTTYLWPHFQLEQLAATLKFTTELTRGRTG
jgi:type VI secretion system ImpC/EvpB family protein